MITVVTGGSRRIFEHCHKFILSHKKFCYFHDDDIRTPATDALTTLPTLQTPAFEMRSLPGPRATPTLIHAELSTPVITRQQVLTHKSDLHREHGFTSSAFLVASCKFQIDEQRRRCFVSREFDKVQF
ncbi:hypothetical protein E5676_scaffold384G003290 [Cucumis melo var. makuwa]|uniref:Uncharacterized protein n=2 Tax=Cucumis melo TaxID=3656 RepID=A0A5D3DW78_CUCMM|nr:hypothetical protein E6C27_scaffold1505G00390 [Cucumis melo var. makuwa]TYK28067.1 hypothetical protein E5676_scaffold384G003290 [Cucumis melo var. makuwa]